MLLLALDTSTEKGSLALAAQDRLLIEYSWESPGTYLTRLLPGVEVMLKTTGGDLAEVEAIAVSQGPGNFTGLRIGLATAKALAWAVGCPLVPVPTLEVLAAHFPYQDLPVGVLMDAKRQEIYFQVFLCRESQPQPVAEAVRLPLPALLAQLQPPILLTGPGLEVYREALAGGLAQEVYWAPREMRYPRAATLAHLALGRLKQGLTVPPPQLVPMYLRPAL
jgi:tRNA threonylcarbamoyladenosine biosynthesis protein TsaB